MHLGADVQNESDVNDLPKYIPTYTFSAFPNEKELLFCGKKCKFKIQNIYENGWQSHGKEISALNVLQKLLENGNVEWKSVEDEVALIQQYIELEVTEYVHL